MIDWMKVLKRIHFQLQTPFRMKEANLFYNWERRKKTCHLMSHLKKTSNEDHMIYLIDLIGWTSINYSFLFNEKIKKFYFTFLKDVKWLSYDRFIYALIKPKILKQTNFFFVKKNRLFWLIVGKREKETSFSYLILHLK